MNVKRKQQIAVGSHIIRIGFRTTYSESY